MRRRRQMGIDKVDVVEGGGGAVEVDSVDGG